MSQSISRRSFLKCAGSGAVSLAAALLTLFACIFPDGLEGKHLLLVDDVLTTGATVVSCADAFRGIPGLRISVLTLALAGES